MKKIILTILLLITCCFIPRGVNAQNAGQRIGGGTIYWISDSNYFRMNKQTLFSFGIKSYGASTFYGSSLYSGANLIVNDGVLGVTGTGYFSMGGVNINTLVPFVADTNRLWRTTWIDLLIANAPTFTGLGIFDSLKGNAIRANGSVLSLFTDTDNSIEILNTHIRITGKNKIDLKTDQTLRAQIDDDSNKVKTDFIIGLTKDLVMQAGQVISDSGKFANILTVRDSAVATENWSRNNFVRSPGIDTTVSLIDGDVNVTGYYKTIYVNESNLDAGEVFHLPPISSVGIGNDVTVYSESLSTNFTLSGADGNSITGGSIEVDRVNACYTLRAKNSTDWIIISQITGH